MNRANNGRTPAVSQYSAICIFVAPFSPFLAIRASTLPHGAVNPIAPLVLRSALGLATLAVFGSLAGFAVLVFTAFGAAAFFSALGFAVFFGLVVTGSSPLVSVSVSSAGCSKSSGAWLASNALVALLTHVCAASLKFAHPSSGSACAPP